MMTLETSITRRPTPVRAVKWQLLVRSDVYAILKHMLTGSGLAEDRCVRANLDGLIASDGARNDDDLGGVASHSGLERIEGGNGHGGSGASSSCATFQRLGFAKYASETCTYPPLRVA